MKKMLIMLIMSIVMSNYAFEDLQSTTPPKKEETRNTFLDATSPFMQGYEDTHDGLSFIDEYDQNITDNVTPPKVSAAEAMFKEALGALLVRYISLKETARVYIKEFKDVLVKWYYTIIPS